ncbi:MAG: STAS domain-containing protein [Spirochaetes bacterium]|nr:STAS domain-containing protein [Spirochaetota bacterium]
MKIAIENHGDNTIIYVEGEIDLYSATEFKNNILFQINNNKINQLILSLDGVTYIDSSGINAIITIYKIAKDSNILLTFTNITEPVMKLIKLTKLHQFLPIAPSIDALSTKK